MIKIHSNIVIGSPTDLIQYIPYINYVINCSINLNNLFIDPNYINLNITKFDFSTLEILNKLVDFISYKISQNQNIFLLCENGINHSLIVGMFLIMKIHKINYNDVYYYLSSIHQINNYDFYCGLKYYEPYIIVSAINHKMEIDYIN
jgi:hypothetical protein